MLHCACAMVVLGTIDQPMSILDEAIKNAVYRDSRVLINNLLHSLSYIRRGFVITQARQAVNYHSRGGYHECIHVRENNFSLATLFS
jgi:hypothetical protein